MPHHANLPSFDALEDRSWLETAAWSKDKEKLGLLASLTAAGYSRPEAESLAGEAGLKRLLDLVAGGCSLRKARGRAGGGGGSEAEPEPEPEPEPESESGSGSEYLFPRIPRDPQAPFFFLYDLLTGGCGAAPVAGDSAFNWGCLLLRHLAPGELSQRGLHLSILRALSYNRELAKEAPKLFDEPKRTGVAAMVMGDGSLAGLPLKAAKFLQGKMAELQARALTF